MTLNVTPASPYAHVRTTTIAVANETAQHMSLIRRVRQNAKTIARISLRATERLRRRRIVVFHVWPDFKNKAHALADLLRKNEFPVVLSSGHSTFTRNRIAASLDLYVGFWNDYPTVYLPKSYVFFNAEPLTIPRWRDNVEWFEAMRGARQVWDYARTNESFITPLRVPFRYVPFGYAPYYEATFRSHTSGVDSIEDIDVLFFGTVSERRRAVLTRLEALGAKVRAITHDSPLRGAELDRAIARSKIVVHVHSFDDPVTHIADFARLDHLLSNRRFVLHENLHPIGSDAAFERAVVTCSYNDLPDRCLYYLSREDERRRVASAAYEWFRAERALDHFIPYDELRSELENDR